MGDLTHPDSDWATLGSAVVSGRKGFNRLERPTAEQVRAARQILGIHKSLPRTKRPNGRPRKRVDLLKAAALRKQGLTWDEVAKRLGVHRNTLLVLRREMTSNHTNATPV